MYTSSELDYEETLLSELILPVLKHTLFSRNYKKHITPLKEYTPVSNMIFFFQLIYCDYVAFDFDFVHILKQIFIAKNSGLGMMRG